MELDAAALDRLIERAEREVDEGLLPGCQIAIGHRGEIVLDESIGDAEPGTRYCIFSATKAFVAAAVWQLISEGLVDTGAKVADVIPEFGTNGKDVITVEQVMLHTAGFPHAPMPPTHWARSATRRERMSQWRLNWEPGTRYEYHATSAHWVLGEIIVEVTGNDYRDEVHRRVTEPLGMRRILGLAPSDQDDIADLTLVGEHATPDELEAVLGVRSLPVTEVTDDAVMRFNRADTREVGVPGGGGFASARDLAGFYQALLHDPSGMWDPELLADVTGRVRQNLPSPDGIPAQRTLGLVLAGDDGLSNRRGKGRTVSPGTFGHNGAGGQLAWADPVSGISLGYVTNGYDRHEIRRPRRDTAIGSLAGALIG